MKPQSIVAKGRKRDLIIPLIFWGFFVGLLRHPPGSNPVAAQAAFFLLAGLLTYLCAKSAFSELEASDGFLTVRWMGRFEGRWAYAQLTRVETGRIRFMDAYYVYTGKKCVAAFSSDFKNGRALYQFLSDVLQ